MLDKASPSGPLLGQGQKPMWAGCHCPRRPLGDKRMDGAPGPEPARGGSPGAKDPASPAPRPLPSPAVHAMLWPALERQHEVSSTWGTPGTSGGVPQGSGRRKTTQASHPGKADHTVQASWSSRCLDRDAGGWGARVSHDSWTADSPAGPRAGCWPLRPVETSCTRGAARAARPWGQGSEAAHPCPQAQARGMSTPGSAQRTVSKAGPSWGSAQREGGPAVPEGPRSGPAQNTLAAGS